MVSYDNKWLKHNSEVNKRKYEIFVKLRISMGRLKLGIFCTNGKFIFYNNKLYRFHKIVVNKKCDLIFEYK